MTTIRPRTEADIPSTVAALTTLYKTENYPLGANRNLQDFLTNPKNETSWVALSPTNKIIGHVATSTKAHDDCLDVWRSLHPDQTDNEEGGLAVLSRLFVLPEGRRGGVAAELVETAVKWNAERGIRLLLAVMVNSAAAIKLYDRLGWTRYGVSNPVLPDGQVAEALCFAGPAPVDAEY